MHKASENEKKNIRANPKSQIVKETHPKTGQMNSQQIKMIHAVAMSVFGMQMLIQEKKRRKKSKNKNKNPLSKYDFLNLTSVQRLYLIVHAHAKRIFIASYIFFSSSSSYSVLNKCLE